jgi:nucleoside-diphosphate-sugar epimerase
MQTILGANGTIGNELARELRKYTDGIRLVSRKPRKVNEDDELLPADLTQEAEVERAVANSRVVYLTIGFDYRIDVWRAEWPKLMRNVVRACAEHRAKLVFFDNVYAYSVDAIPHMTEDAPIAPSSEKGMSLAATPGWRFRLGCPHPSAFAAMGA